MFKVLRADKDTYITNRVINKVRAYTANVGAAGTLDLYKLYGFTSTGSVPVPNTELTRLLVHFDLQPLRNDLSAKTLDTTNASFNAQLKLFDVYGGQPTPMNFTISVFPLSASFDEGLGRDIVLYGDNDVANWLTASANGTWFVTGCASGGLPGSSVDYITASSAINHGASLEVKQVFATGAEDLVVDVTTLVSATLGGLLPDVGFRITLSASLESDAHSYFVKRFVSHTAYDPTLHPQLIVRFDDSVQDDSQNLYLDSPSYLFLYNYVRQAPANLTSGSALTPITGSNSLILKLRANFSGVIANSQTGSYELSFTGSQHTLGINPVTGIYSASVSLSSSDAVLSTLIAQSGSVQLTPIWGSLDGSVSFLTGSVITLLKAQRGSTQLAPKNFNVSVYGLQDSHFTNDLTMLRVNIFDYTSPYMKVVKTPVDSPGIVVRDVHWQVRDAVSHDVIVPFDTVHNSTRCSSDGSGMFFQLDMSNLAQNHSFVIDIMVVTVGNKHVYKAASPVFRVSDTS